MGNGIKQGISIGVSGAIQSCQESAGARVCAMVAGQPVWQWDRNTQAWYCIQPSAGQMQAGVPATAQVVSPPQPMPSSCMSPTHSPMMASPSPIPSMSPPPLPAFPAQVPTMAPFQPSPSPGIQNVAAEVERATQAALKNVTGELKELNEYGKRRRETDEATVKAIQDSCRRQASILELLTRGHVVHQPPPLSPKGPRGPLLAAFDRVGGPCTC